MSLSGIIHHSRDILYFKTPFIRVSVKCVLGARAGPGVGLYLIDVHQNASLSDFIEGERSRVIGNRCNSGYQFTPHA